MTHEQRMAELRERNDSGDCGRVASEALEYADELAAIVSELRKRLDELAVYVVRCSDSPLEADYAVALLQKLADKGFPITLAFAPEYWASTRANAAHEATASPGA